MEVILVGLAVGLLLSVPPTGPVDLLVVRHLVAGEEGRGLRIALGSSIADLPYAWLGALGYGWVVARQPTVAAGFDLVGAALLVAIAVDVVARPLDRRRGRPSPHWSDVLTGLVLGLLNVSRLLSWSVTASVLAPVLAGTDAVGLFAYAVAAAAGELVWFGALASFARKWATWGHTVHRWLERAIALLAVVLALWLAGRALHAWLGGSGTLAACPGPSRPYACSWSPISSGAPSSSAGSATGAPRSSSPMSTPRPERSSAPAAAG